MVAERACLLTLNLVQTAKGDTHGVVFDHLRAVGPLLTEMLSHPASPVQGDLRNFIIEYYVYTAATSMLSIDPVYGTAPFLTPDLVVQGQALAATGYQGQLCGCWLELISLIPSIFEFGRRARAPKPEPAAVRVC